MFYLIATENRNYYIVNKEMEIIQYNASKKPQEHSFSGNWKVKGISPILPFGNRGNCFSISNLLNSNDSISLRYKNGKGNHVLHDIDHGTQRTWSDRITRISVLL